MHNNLFALRTKHGYSQQRLADLVGVTKLTFGRWERGETAPRKVYIDQLCTVFECHESDLGFSDGEAPFTNVVTSQETSPVPYHYDPAIPLASATPFVGRERDLARIKEQLCQNESSVVITALNGMPGVGKTSLAVTLVHDATIRAYFSDGILWAGLGPTPNHAGLLNRWGTLLGLSETHLAALDSDEKKHALHMAIGIQSMLLILDDVWRLEDLLALRIGGSNCAYLITTRFPMIAAQAAVDSPILIEELDEEHSMQLLRVLAPEVVLHEYEKTRHLVHAVGGLPLALTLLGNYLRKHSYNVPARRAVAALERLSNTRERFQISEPHMIAEAHPSLSSDVPISLESILMVTDQLLTTTAREALYALSVFPPKPESFSEEAALAVAMCSINELDELLDAGLLEYPGNERYRLHQIIADYAHLHLDEHARQRVTLRLLRYTQQYVNRYDKDYERLEQEMTLLLSALDLAMTEAPFQSHLVAFVCEAAPFLLMRGYYQEIQRFLEYALTLATKSHDLEDSATLLFFLGDVSQKRGNLLRAKEQYEQGRRIAQEVNDPALMGWLTHRVGWMSLKLGEYTQAEALLQQGLSLARKAEQPELLCEICKTFGSFYADRADYQKAEAYTREGLALAQQLGDRQRIVILLTNLGATLGLQVSPEAPICFQEALQLAREIKSDELCCLSLLNLGDWYTLTDPVDYQRAEGFLAEALTMARRKGNTEWISAALATLTAVLRLQERFDETHACIQESLILAHQVERPRLLCCALDEVGNLALAQGDLQQALEAFQQMVQRCPEGDFELQAMSMYGLARTYEQLEQWEQATSLGQQAVSLIQQKKIARHIEQITSWYAQFTARSTSVS